MQSLLRRAGLGAFLLNIVLSAHACAQTAVDGAIRGVVLDPTGTAMPNATIQAQDLATHLTLQTTSTRTGAFVLPNIPPSQY